MIQYIAYYRKSPGGNKTQQQLQDSLGVESQRNSCAHYVTGHGLIVAEYSDMETGKNDNRPELLKALQHAKECDCTLLIAKLDRLSRNLTFISTLMDTGVKFKCVDMPDANNFTIHIFAALAQQEREMISKRVTAALAVAKDRGKKLGYKADGTHNFSTCNAGREKSIAVRKQKAADNIETKKARAMVLLLRDKMTLANIAEHLNNAGFRTPTGKLYTAVQISRLTQL